MATIIEHGYGETGYLAYVRLVDGRERHFHWLTQPTDIQAAVDKAETDLKYGEIEMYRRTHYVEDDPRWLR